MPRIPEAEIERLKRETDLAALVRSRGIELKPHGSKDLVGKCPFHQEDQPSFIVSPGKGLFHCMGCGVAGNCIQFVQKFDGVSFRHAFEILAGGKAFADSPTEPVKVSTVPRLELPLNPESTDAELMSQIVDYYHERLFKTPAAVNYLKGRGLYDEACPQRREAIEKFKLGCADRTLGLRLPNMNRKEGEAIRKRLQKLGIYRQNGREHLNGRIVFPIPCPDGRMKLYGRLFGKPNPGAPKHLYLPGPHEGIWNLEALNEPEIILCEAAFDALTFWINGFKNVTFTCGNEGFIPELLDAILAHRVKRVKLAYDADESGNRAATRDTERFLTHGIEVFRVKFPWGMDANEYAQKVTPADKSLAVLLNAAEWQGRSSPTRAPAPSSSELAAKLVAKEKEAACPERSRRADETSADSASLRETSSLERSGEYHVLKLGPREYRVGGLEKNNSLEVLKVAVRLRHVEDFHLDSFDMARDGERRRFIERAAEETKLEKDLIKRDLGKLLLALEQEQTDRINAALEPTHAPRPHELSAEERAEALAFLKSPDLVEKIGAAFETCGLVGETTNRLAAYLACTSRKLDRPLAIIIQSTTAAGKSTLLEAVLAMFPEEERVKYSAMTGQSLYYLGETDLKHKILAIVEEEGAEKASYPLKLLQSEGELTIASTGKDPQTGRMETQEYHVEGPVMIFLTTSAVEIDEELLNRCLILTVDESREQTERIHALQRKARTLDGLRLKKRKQKLLALMRNVQRLLRPLDVMNPWADDLTFTAERTRTRRDHEKYLTLIDAIALLHQHQRPVERDDESGEFIRVTLDDIALANRLAPELLGRTLDELPPQTRRLLEAVKSAVKATCKERDVEQPLALFSRRDLQAACGWSYSQVKRHLFRLQELEYVAPRFGRMGATLKYELLIDPDEPTEVAHIGLLDVEKLRVAATCPSKLDERSRKSQPDKDGKKVAPTLPTLTGPEATLTPPCQNPMTRLSPTTAGTSVNLATLPARESGALAAALS